MGTSTPAPDVRVIRNAQVTTRDGVGLATTVILPARDGSFPVVLVRTAYNRGGMRSTWFAEHGMALVTQDCRGRYGSGGTHVPFRNEAADGYDTLKWIAEQPWCNGRIGMYGDSYLAATQFSAVQEGAHLLQALNPRFMAGDCWKRAYYCDGAFSLGLTWSWLCFECSGRTSGAALMPLLDVDAVLRELPVLTLDEKSGGGVQEHYREYVRHNVYSDFWRSLNMHESYDRFTMPVLLTAGWYDNYPAEAVKMFTGLTRSAGSETLRRSHRLLIGPWTHGVNATTRLGEVDFGQDALRENDATLRWLEAVLIHDCPDAFQEAPIRIFVMGINRWRDLTEWPPGNCAYRRFYLHSSGSAAAPGSDGRLSGELPEQEPCDQFTYDPANPVPTLGGNHSIGPYNPGLFELAPPGPFDQRPIEERADVLVYTSEPLTADTEVTGPVTLKLWAASSAPDTDLVARLVDVHPDGRAINLTEGILRARFRNSVWARPELMEPGTVYPFTIDMQVTSNVFGQGHCIRLDLTSSSFPLWDRNLNTGNDPATDTDMQSARQSICHDALHPSHLLLPIVPG